MKTSFNYNTFANKLRGFGNDVGDLERNPLSNFDENAKRVRLEGLIETMQHLATAKNAMNDQGKKFLTRPKDLEDITTLITLCITTLGSNPADLELFKQIYKGGNAEIDAALKQIESTKNIGTAKIEIISATMQLGNEAAISKEGYFENIINNMNALTEAANGANKLLGDEDPEITTQPIHNFIQVLQDKPQALEMFRQAYKGGNEKIDQALKETEIPTFKPMVYDDIELASALKGGGDPKKHPKVSFNPLARVNFPDDTNLHSVDLPTQPSIPGKDEDPLGSEHGIDIGNSKKTSDDGTVKLMQPASYIKRRGSLLDLANAKDGSDSPPTQQYSLDDAASFITSSINRAGLNSSASMQNIDTAPSLLKLTRGATATGDLGKHQQQVKDKEAKSKKEGCVIS